MLTDAYLQNVDRLTDELIVGNRTGEPTGLAGLLGEPCACVPGETLCGAHELQARARVLAAARQAAERRHADQAATLRRLFGAPPG